MLYTQVHISSEVVNTHLLSSPGHLPGLRFYTSSYYFPPCHWARTLWGYCGQTHHVCSTLLPYTPLWTHQSFHLCISALLSLVLHHSCSCMTSCCLSALICSVSRACCSSWCSPCLLQGLPGTLTGSSLSKLSPLWLGEPHLGPPCLPLSISFPYFLHIAWDYLYRDLSFRIEQNRMCI